jgi:hypothetical protein
VLLWLITESTGGARGGDAQGAPKAHGTNGKLRVSPAEAAAHLFKSIRADLTKLARTRCIDELSGMARGALSRITTSTANATFTFTGTSFAGLAIFTASLQGLGSVLSSRTLFLGVPAGTDIPFLAHFAA